MRAEEWRTVLGGLVLKSMNTPEMEHYYSIKLSKPRAQLITSQSGIFTRHRRDCWSNVSANCPILEIKRKILEHENEEVIADDYSDSGHFALVLKQGERLGMQREEIINAKPIPTTMTALYAWGWITRAKSWVEGLAAMTITEWTNDDRLLADMGGGNTRRTANRMMADLGITWAEIPSHHAHSQADEKHSDMFLGCFERHVQKDEESQALAAAEQSLDLMALYRVGIGKAMERLP
jgi:pyrroloquinoline quinone (PQQ) biosynthesis protein C